MVVAFKLNSNSKELNAKMARIAMRQLPFAAAVSLTKTGQALVEQNERDMRKTFEKPVGWTLKAFRRTVATKSNLRTIVKRKDQARGLSTNTTPNRQHYLEVQDSGGTRPMKAFEKAIKGRARGASRFNYVTPTRDAPKTSTGNVTRGYIGKVLSETSQKGGKFFVPKSDHPLALRGGDGVFERMARGKVKKRLHLHNKMPNYRARLRFHDRMYRYGRMAFPKVFRQELRSALLKSGFGR